MTDGIAAGRNWPVTDHAVMRWLERIMRMDARGARRRLRAAGMAHVRDADVIELLLLQAGWSVEAVCRAILPEDRLHLLSEATLPVASWICIINEGLHGRQVVTVIPRHAASPKARRGGSLSFRNRCRSAAAATAFRRSLMRPSLPPTAAIWPSAQMRRPWHERPQ